MLEVDNPVWGVRELWLSADGDFTYHSGEAGEKSDVFGLPNEDCQTKMNASDVSASVDRLRSTQACAEPKSDAQGGTARTMSLCVAVGDYRCWWSAAPAKAPASTQIVLELIRKACAQPGARQRR